MAESHDEMKESAAAAGIEYEEVLLSTRTHSPRFGGKNHAREQGRPSEHDFQTNKTVHRSPQRCILTLLTVLSSSALFHYRILWRAMEPADVVMRFGKVASDRTTHIQIPILACNSKGIELISLIEVWGRVKLFTVVKSSAILKRVWTRAVISILAQGPGISVLLHQRGFLTLHAGCVRIGQTCCCIHGAFRQRQIHHCSGPARERAWSGG